MIGFTDITGLLSTTLFSTTVLCLVFPFNRISVPGRCAVFFLFICLVFVPFAPGSAAVYMRSFIGDLSITNLLILFSTLLGQVFGLNLVQRRTTHRFCLLLLPLALVFYPLAMGLGKYDPYALGYGSPYLLGIVFLITLLAWTVDQRFIATSLSLSVFCYAIGWYESNNLWDYLIDPVLTVYALAVFIKSQLLRIPFNLRRPTAKNHSQRMVR